MLLDTHNDNGVYKTSQDICRPQKLRIKRSKSTQMLISHKITIKSVTDKQWIPFVIYQDSDSYHQIYENFASLSS